MSSSRDDDLVVILGLNNIDVSILSAAVATSSSSIVVASAATETVSISRENVLEPQEKSNNITKNCI